MNSKIAPLAPLSLTPSNSKGKGGLAPLSTPLSTDKLEKPKSRGDKSASKSHSEKKKARKLKMEKLRQTKYATQIQAAWRGKIARKHGLQSKGVAARQAKSYFLNSCEKSMKKLDMKEMNPETETMDGLSLTRKGDDEVNDVQTTDLVSQNDNVSSEMKQELNKVIDGDVPRGRNEASDQTDTIPSPVAEQVDKQAEGVLEENEVVSLAVKEKESKDSNIDTSSIGNTAAKDNHLQSEFNDDKNPPATKDESVEEQQAQQQVPGGATSEDVQEPSKWPDSPHESFSTIGDTSITWPDLSDFSSETVLQWVLEHQQILIRTVTWNMQANDPPAVDQVRQQLLPLNRFHIIGFGTEECERSIAKSALNPSKKVWENYMLDLVGEQYIPLRSHTLQAIHLMLFVHKSIEPLITNVSSAAVACGMANTLGNKGGVGISFNVANSRVLLLNTHLSAHQEKVEERNDQIWKILNELPSMLNMNEGDGKTELKRGVQSETVVDDSAVDGPSNKSNTPESDNSVNKDNNQVAVASTDEDDQKLISDGDTSKFNGVSKIEKYFDCLIFMGDMNYRINGNRKVIDKLLQANMHEVLMSNDQLTASFKQKRLPDFLIESPVTFRPTYKFDKNSDVYDTSAKKRIPSWTDRILYKADNLTCLCYNSVPDIRISDHRPVYGSFVAKVLVVKEHVKNDDKIAFSSESQVCTIM